MLLVAKPVVDNQYWILKREDKKIGIIERDTEGLVVRIENKTQRFKTIPMARDRGNIQFEPASQPVKPSLDSVHGYATGCKVYNSLWDVKHRLPLFTKSPKSKSWYAAGYYCVKQNNRWQVVRNPKFIILERYNFLGPFHNREEANDQPIP